MGKTAQVTVLGSGTSVGVPMIACDCRICSKPSPKNTRYRSSIAITLPGNSHVVIDTTPEFRLQMLRAKIQTLSHVLLTHTHADHCHGFDDVRAFYFRTQKPLNVWIHPDNFGDLRSRFSYVFENTHYVGIKPQVEVHECKDVFQIEGIEVDPIRLPHGVEQTTAFRFGKFAYATDFKQFPPELIERWKGKIHTMIASGLQFKPHATHSSIPETIELFRALKVEHGILTHLSHSVDYERDQATMPSGVELAYDGMTLNVELD